jgi:hypothetical protein
MGQEIAFSNMKIVILHMKCIPMFLAMQDVAGC